MFESFQMNKFIYLIILFLIFFNSAGLCAVFQNNSKFLGFESIPPDSLPQYQILYNGRVWRNLYYKVKEDQFLFSKEFLPASITMNGKSFTNVKIKYDIYNDQILTPMDSGGILQLNKEMVDSFSIFFKNKTYQFTKIPDENQFGLNGYVNVIYDGKSTIYVKYIKKITPLAFENKYDEFYQISRIYLIKDNQFFLITKKGDLFKVLNDKKLQIRDFMKRNSLRVSNAIPESFIPVIQYYDSIK